MSELILVTSKTCGPCFMLKNRIEKEGLKVTEYDAYEHLDFIREHDIRSVPRLVVLKDGEPTKVIQGMDEIVERIKKG